MDDILAELEAPYNDYASGITKLAWLKRLVCTKCSVVVVVMRCTFCPLMSSVCAFCGAD
jgi:hypothetical protein